MPRTLAGPLVMLICAAFMSTLASATSQRTFVRSDGLDNPACSLTAPCRQLAAAVAATSPNGEVIILDSAGYGPVTINKSVSIIAPVGVYAGITVFTGNGVTVNAATTDKVVLRGLSINGQGGASGIALLQAGEVHVEDCVISRMAADGISATPPNGSVVVKDTVLRDNAGSGFSITGTSGLLEATLSRVHLTGNGNGLFATGKVTAIIGDSVISGNGVGLRGDGPDIGITTITASHNKITQNTSGISVTAMMGLVYALLDGNLLSYNSNAVSIGSNSIGYTWGNNVYANNISDGSPLTSQSPK